MSAAASSVPVIKIEPFIEIPSVPLKIFPQIILRHPTFPSIYSQIGNEVLKLSRNISKLEKSRCLNKIETLKKKAFSLLKNSAFRSLQKTTRAAEAPLPREKNRFKRQRRSSRNVG